MHFIHCLLCFDGVIYMPCLPFGIHIFQCFLFFDGAVYMPCLPCGIHIFHCFLLFDVAVYKTIFTISEALQRVVLCLLLPVLPPGPQVSDSTLWRFQNIDFCQRSGINLRELRLRFTQILCQTCRRLYLVPLSVCLVVWPRCKIC